MYKHSNNKTMTSGAIAAMLSTILYSRRFFPYYVYNIIGGLDEEGRYLDASASEIRKVMMCSSVCMFRVYLHYDSLICCDFRGQEMLRWSSLWFAYIMLQCITHLGCIIFVVSKLETVKLLLCSCNNCCYL